MRFAALGRTHWLYDAIVEAVQRGHQPALIGTCPAAPEYRRTEADFEALARELGVPFFCDSRINRAEYVEMCRASGAPVAISVNWLTLVGAEVRAAFPLGVVNAHLGDLPRYRGNAVPNWAILNGEPRVALTLHEMSDDLDAGDIYLQEPFALGDDTYIGDVYRFADAAMPAAFAQLLDGLDDGTVVKRPQSADAADALRCFPRTPADGLLEWSAPATQLARLVRASAEPFAGAYTYLDGERLTVWRAYAAELPYPWVGRPGQVAERRPETGEVAVLTGQGVLVLQEVETTAGRVSAAQALPSTRMRLGIDADALWRRVRAFEERLAEEGS